MNSFTKTLAATALALAAAFGAPALSGGHHVDPVTEHPSAAHSVKIDPVTEVILAGGCRVDPVTEVIPAGCHRVDPVTE
ncbi:MAG: hypothetical protein LKG20_10110 [Tetrasphaera jenkinsii]|jgi:hypothetical protein|nr:hypothetical protein [Tetrasphaera jenkinsii]